MLGNADASLRSSAVVVRLPIWDREFRSAETNTLELVSRFFVSWNRLDGWLRRIDGLRRAA
jgi:hypothetical protein